MIDFTKVIGFQWDLGNAQKSALKHDVLPSEAEEVFFNSPLLISDDEQHSENEQRFWVLGVTHKKRALTIIFTLRQDKTLIRVISAIDQHRKERLLYAKAN